MSSDSDDMEMLVTTANLLLNGREMNVDPNDLALLCEDEDEDAAVVTTAATEPEAAETAAAPSWWTHLDDIKWAEVLFVTKLYLSPNDWVFESPMFIAAFPRLRTTEARFEAKSYFYAALLAPSPVAVHLQKLRTGHARVEHMDQSSGRQKRSRPGLAGQQKQKVWVKESGRSFYTDEDGRVIEE